MKLIQDNPYRFLGVYANSTIKERLANKNKLRAFLKIGKDVTFPLDLSQYLPSVNRTENNIADAEAKLALPTGQIRYAQFWFIKETPFDDVAFNHLLAGDMEKAVEIWEKKNCVSSLQNRIVCALIKENYSVVLECAEKLYCSKEFVSHFVEQVLGDVTVSSTDNYVYDFLDDLCDEIGADNLIPNTAKISWKKHIKERIAKPLIDTIQKAIDEAKTSKDKDADTRLSTGQKLSEIAQKSLQQLKNLLRTSDLQYRMLADKLGLEILQCGIDYYNKSDKSDSAHTVDVAHKAMALQAYALKIVLGQMAKERCQQNVDILKKIIDSLPPLSVVSEYEKIRCELKKYCNTLAHVNTLLNNTDAAIKSISSKLGKTDGYYRSISTEIVNKALSTLIDVVNSAQENVSTSSIAIIKEAWRVTQRLDNFDMEYEFKIKRYIPNRKILKEIVEQIQENEIQSLFTHKGEDKVDVWGGLGEPTPGRPFRGNKPNNIPTEDDNGGCIQSAIVVIFIVLIFLLLKGCGSDNGASYTSGLGTTSDSDTALLVDTNYSSSYSDELVNNDTLANNDTVTDYDDDSQYESHHLTTGTKPYSNAYGKGLTGENWLDFKTSGSNDYVVIVKKYNSERVINHIYIRGGTSARLYLPNGVYSLYFYSGQGWNPNKTPNSDKPQIVGGFVKYENILKDEPVSLHDQYGEYTLYPVKNGNLSLESSDENEAF